MKKITFAVSFLLLSLALTMWAQDIPADSITNPDIILRTTPSSPSLMQKEYEKAEQYRQYQRDKEDPRRATLCI